MDVFFHWTEHIFPFLIGAPLMILMLGQTILTQHTMLGAFVLVANRCYLLTMLLAFLVIFTPLPKEVHHRIYYYV